MKKSGSQNEGVSKGLEVEAAFRMWWWELLQRGPKIKIRVSKWIVLVFSAFGLVIALWLLSKLSTGEIALWESLGQPPERIVKFAGLYPCSFVAGQGDGKATVFVESVSHTVYSYSLCPDKSQQWQAAVVPERLKGFDCYSTQAVSSAPYFAAFRNDVAQCTSMISSWEIINDRSLFIVLKDNTVWWWREYATLDRLFAFACVGPVIGALVGVAVSIAIQRKRRLQSA